MNKERKDKIVSTFVLLVVASLFLFGIFGVLKAYYQIQTSGTVNVSFVGIQGYFDSECTVPADLINWGTLETGGSGFKNIYLLNNGTLPVSLDLTVEGWVPVVAQNFLSLSWNYTGTTLPSDGVCLVRLKLSVSSDGLAMFEAGLKSFSFSVVIYATETYPVEP